MIRHLVTLSVSMLALAAPLAAQQSSSSPAATDGRWAPFLGCWRAVEDTAGNGTHVCVDPAEGGAVAVTTLAGGQRLSREVRKADGTAYAIDSSGCTGTETARWAPGATRLYRTASVACDNSAARTLKSVSFFAAGPVWIDVETVEFDGTTNVRVSRLVRGGTQRALDGEQLGAGPATAPSAIATAPFTVADVIDLSKALPADGVQAALAEAPTTYRLNAPALIAMSEAGVGDLVIDLMVGLTYPAKFVVKRSEPAAWSGGGPGFSALGDPFFSPIVGPAALNCYASYGWASSSYWGNCTGMNQAAFALMGSPFWGGYWGPFGPNQWVTTQGPSVATNQQPERSGGGRLVNGRGYTQVSPVDTTFTAAGGMGNGTMADGSGSNGSSSGSGVSSGGYSGGGGDGGRMAVPRGPGL